MGSLLKFYKHLLNRYPFSSQAIQTGILMGCGDLIAQTAVEKQPLQSVDAKRTGQFITVGTLLVVSKNILPFSRCTNHKSLYRARH